MTADEPLGQRAESVINELLGWLTGPDSGQNDGLTDAVALIQEALAANADLTARVEAAEGRRDSLQRRLDAEAVANDGLSNIHAARCKEHALVVAALTADRDAALARAVAAEAQAGRLREALRAAARTNCEGWCSDGGEGHFDDCLGCEFIAALAASETGAPA